MRLSSRASRLPDGPCADRAAHMSEWLLHDDEWCSMSPPSDYPGWDERITCGMDPEAVVSVICRTCGARGYPICGDHLELLIAALEAQALIFCTEIAMRHEVIAVVGAVTME